jgi:hypothetical protein
MATDICQEYGGLVGSYDDLRIIATSTTAAKLATFDTNSPSSEGVTPDHTTDDITVDKRGDYYVEFNAIFGANTDVSETWTIGIRVDDVATDLEAVYNSGAAVVSDTFTLSGYLSLTADQVVSVFIEALAGTPDINPEVAQLSLLRPIQ